MKLLLIEPTRYLENRMLLKATKLLFPSLTLARLASLTPETMETTIVIELFEDINFDETVDLVGITSYTTNIHRAYEVADEFRRRKIPVVMGGIHVSMEPEEALAHADTVIIGEAEDTWPQFINEFRRGIHKRVYQAQERTSLTNLPLPRFSLIKKRAYLGYQYRDLSRFFMTPVFPIETARGCPHSCAHCVVTRFFGGRYRLRPIDDVVNEIKTLGAKICFFIDDNIFANPARAKELFQALIPLKILWVGMGPINAAADKELIHLARKSGCSSLGIGLESLSHMSLDAIGKKTNKVEEYEQHLYAYRKEGISAIVSMMFGFDEEGSEVFKETYEFLMKNRVPFTSWWPLIPFPGTPLYQQLKAQGRLKDERWWLTPSWKIYSLRFTGTRMDEEVFCRNFYYYYQRFFSLGSITRRILLPPQQRFLFKTIVNLVFRKKLTNQATMYEH